MPDSLLRGSIRGLLQFGRNFQVGIFFSSLLFVSPSLPPRLGNTKTHGSFQRFWIRVFEVSGCYVPGPLKLAWTAIDSSPPSRPISSLSPSFPLPPTDHDPTEVYTVDT